MTIHEEFIREYSACEQDIRYYISSLVMNKSDVDDIVQETAVQLWKKAEQWDSDRPFLPWAFGFAFNAVRDYRSKLSTRKKYFSDKLIEQIVEDQSGYHEELSRVDIALKSQMAKMSDRDRLLVEHRYCAGVTVIDLAEKLGEKPDALYKRLQRIREKLIKSIELELKRA